ncbi:MAG: hypothetical protein NDJ89_18955 [Oligoflexia bacterium]|nr:hypothetical protein [Oligoflexia bacterium]
MRLSDPDLIARLLPFLRLSAGIAALGLLAGALLVGLSGKTRLRKPWMEREAFRLALWAFFSWTLGMLLGGFTDYLWSGRYWSWEARRIGMLLLWLWLGAGIALRSRSPLFVLVALTVIGVTGVYGR